MCLSYSRAGDQVWLSAGPPWFLPASLQIQSGVHYLCCGTIEHGCSCHASRIWEQVLRSGKGASRALLGGLGVYRIRRKWQAIRRGTPRLQGGADSSPQAGARPGLACWAGHAIQGEPTPCWRAALAPAKADELSIPSLQWQPVSLNSQPWSTSGSPGDTTALSCQAFQPCRQGTIDSASHTCALKLL